LLPRGISGMACEKLARKPLGFRGYAAAASQARRMAWISWGVGWSRVSRNC
jgi:hypothetical protein